MNFTSMVEAQYSELLQTVEASRAGIAVVEQMAQAVVKALRNGNKILTAGNGGSAADALHMAEELVGRYRTNRPSLPGISLAADVTAVTCISNDFGYDQVFVRQIEGLGKPGDILVTFSTSGNSSNIFLAIEAAKRAKLFTINLAGKDGGKCKGLADIEWIVPAKNGARVQEIHTWVMHTILEAVEIEFSK
jgi:D-sedoheptulose 7-phosphate isomerase